jgi:Spy/CpxP family protein refolding chaperone
MKIKILIIALIISLGFNLGVILTIGWKIWGIRQPGCGWQQNRLRAQFDLTPEQINELEEKRTEMQEKLHPIKKELLKKRRELLILQKGATLNEDRLDSLLSEIVHLQYNLEKTVFVHMNDIKGVLTEEQRVQFYHRLEKGLCPRENHILYKECERR